MMRWRDMQIVSDAKRPASRWEVWLIGALLFCMIIMPPIVLYFVAYLALCLGGFIVALALTFGS